ncbi:MAG: DeoR/GlpR family DNA-binding transcription regulator [Eubacteriales bacterium]|nr:DeoR/GlpR family DNA-binding transcription regulator [Eubacteriales bacterium]
MLAKERQSNIEKIVKDRGSVSVQELSRDFGYSEVTIRKDLDELAQENRIIRTHGGAMMKYKTRNYTDISELSVIHLREKQMIARRAIEFIEDGDSVILDGSSTIHQLVSLINEKDYQNLTIITNSLRTAQLVTKKNIEIVMIGGVMNRAIGTTEGPKAESQLRSMSADKCFIGTSGIDENFGFSTDYFFDASIKACMCASARKSYVIADYTKFNRRFLVKVFGFETGHSCTAIITDSRNENVDYRGIEKKIPIIFSDENE